VPGWAGVPFLLETYQRGTECAPRVPRSLPLAPARDSEPAHRQRGSSALPTPKGVDRRLVTEQMHALHWKSKKQKQ
jgi:hypothetical protein